MHIERQPSFSESLKTANILTRSDGFVTTDETWSQEPLYAPYTRLYFVLEGNGFLYSENEKIELEPGYVYLAPCGMKYGFYSHSSVTKLYFHINVTFSPGEYDIFSNYIHFIRLPRATEYLKRLKKWYLSEKPYEHMLLKNELYRTVCEALQIVFDQAGELVNYSGATALAIGYIYRNLSATLTVKEVSEGVFCSQSKLSLLFRAELGHSVASYIDDLLMTEAKHKIIYSDDSIGEISEQLGFCDQFYFSRKFTKCFGVSPLRFRKNQRKTE